MHIDHVGTYVARPTKQEAHPRQPANRQVFAASVEYVNVNRIAPHGNGADLDHRKWTYAGVVAWILAKGTFLTHGLRIGVYHIFDDDLGVRGHIEVHRLGPYHLERLLQQAACDL